ncbi:MAG: alkaline phosphatase D family protein, partial [Nannocystaceae bacterium]
RDIEYGQHVHLVMTDLRSYRPDHLVPEDAYPGAVAMDEAALQQVAGDTAGGVPYVDIDTYAEGMYADLLRDVASAESYDPALISGLVSAEYINGVIEDAGSGLPLIEPEQLDTLPRGVAFHQLFKTGLYGQIGARYLIVEPVFLWYAQWLDEQSGGAAQDIMGPQQRSWFLDTMQGSSHTWKVWGNEFCLTPLSIDLTGSFLPEAFRQRFQMSAEDWNGAPHERGRLIDALASVDNVVAITGDIHAFFAGTPFSTPGASEGNRVVELVTGSISSTPYRTILVRQVAADPVLSTVPGIDAFALGIRDLLQGGPNPQMGFADPGQHGFIVVEASGEELLAEYRMHPEELALEPHYDDPGLAAEFTTERFRVLPGSRDLYREINGEWAVWDPATQTWG